MAELTDAQLRDRLAFHREEQRREWCGTLIGAEIIALRAELARRGLTEHAPTSY